MWSYTCGSLVVETHSLKSLIESMAFHRGGNRSELWVLGYLVTDEVCDKPHDLQLDTSKLCDWHSMDYGHSKCRIPFDLSISPAQATAAKILNCRITKV